MVTADAEKTMNLREEARRLALRLNGRKSGILANDGRASLSSVTNDEGVTGTALLWGQDL